MACTGERLPAPDLLLLVVVPEGGVVVLVVELDGGEGEVEDDSATSTSSFMPWMQWLDIPQMK